MKLDLVQVQLEALRRSSAAPTMGFAYFMQQGLGKTLTTLADFQNQVNAGEASRLAVVCPNSFKGGWVAEMEKWKLDFDAHIYDSKSSMNDWWLRKNYNAPPVAIINYEAIRGGSGQEFISKFMQQSAKRAMLTFDESIQLKTHDSAQTVAAIELQKMTELKRILSGKPQTQGPHDLWGQFRSIGQLNGKNYFAFKNAFCKMGGFKNKQVMGAQNEDILGMLIDAHCFYATKEDWTDLPPKSYTIRDYALTPEMKAMYHSMEKEFVLWLENGDAVTIDAAITKYAKLSQIQCGFILDEEGKVHELVEDKKNPRIAALKEFIEDSRGKICIPYVNKHVLKMLMRAFADLNPAYISGGLTTAETEAQKKLFNEDPSCRVIFLQMVASKYGHTLLGLPRLDDHCYTMAFFQNTYSLDDRSQIEDRNHRHGQIADAVLYADFVGTSLDRDAVRALQRKESVFQSVFGPIMERAKAAMRARMQ